MHDYVWQCMTMYDYVWICLTMYDYVWLNITMNDYVWLCMTMHDYVWLCMTTYDYVRLRTTMNGYVWLYMTISARQNLVGIVKKALEKALGTYVTNQRIWFCVGRFFSIKIMRQSYAFRIYFSLLVTYGGSESDLITIIPSQHEGFPNIP